MTKQHSFKRHDADSLILLKGRLVKDDIAFALDFLDENNICIDFPKSIITVS